MSDDINDGMKAWQDATNERMRTWHPAPAAPVPASVREALEKIGGDREYSAADIASHAQKPHKTIDESVAEDALASLPAPEAAPTREEIYDATLRELETRHPIPTTVLLATRITNAILALKAAPAKSEVHHVTLGSDLDDGQRGKERE